MTIPIDYNQTLISPKNLRTAEAYWTYIATTNGESVILPDGRCDVIFRLHKNYPKKIIPVITGPSTKAYRIRQEVGDVWMGIRMRPSNGVLLWNERLEMAVDTVSRGKDALRLLPQLANIDPEQITKKNLGNLLSDLFDCSTINESVDTQNKTIDLIHTSGGRLTVKSLSSLVGFSARHLNRLFIRSVGISIKKYSRLVQFHRSLRLIQEEGLQIAEAAFESGYSDQAHMTRTFQHIGGFSPSKIPLGLTIPELFN